MLFLVEKVKVKYMNLQLSVPKKCLAWASNSKEKLREKLGPYHAFWQIFGAYIAAARRS